MHSLHNGVSAMPADTASATESTKNYEIYGTSDPASDAPACVPEAVYPPEIDGHKITAHAVAVQETDNTTYLKSVLKLENGEECWRVWRKTDSTWDDYGYGPMFPTEIRERLCTVLAACC